MARLVNLKRLLLISIVLGAFFLSLGCAIFLFMPEIPLRFVNVFVPLITLAMLWAIWLRQRRIAALTQARLDETADVFARMSALSDELERELILRHSSPALLIQESEDVDKRLPPRFRRLIH